MEATNPRLEIGVSFLRDYFEPGGDLHVPCQLLADNIDAEVKRKYSVAVKVAKTKGMVNPGRFVLWQRPF